LFLVYKLYNAVYLLKIIVISYFKRICWG